MCKVSENNLSLRIFYCREVLGLPFTTQISLNGLLRVRITRSQVWPVHNDDLWLCCRLPDPSVQRDKKKYIICCSLTPRSVKVVPEAMWSWSHMCANGFSLALALKICRCYSIVELGVSNNRANKIISM